MKFYVANKSQVQIRLIVLAHSPLAVEFVVSPLHFFPSLPTGTRVHETILEPGERLVMEGVDARVRTSFRQDGFLTGLPISRGPGTDPDGAAFYAYIIHPLQTN